MTCMAPTLEVVEVLAEEVDLKDKVDVIVSEWMLGFPGFFSAGPDGLGGWEKVGGVNRSGLVGTEKVGEQTLLYLDRRRSDVFSSSPFESCKYNS